MGLGSPWNEFRTCRVYGERKLDVVVDMMGIGKSDFSLRQFDGAKKNRKLRVLRSNRMMSRGCFAGGPRKLDVASRRRND